MRYFFEQTNGSADSWPMLPAKVANVMMCPFCRRSVGACMGEPFFIVCRGGNSTHLQFDWDSKLMNGNPAAATRLVSEGLKKVKCVP